MFPVYKFDETKSIYVSVNLKIIVKTLDKMIVYTFIK